MRVWFFVLAAPSLILLVGGTALSATTEDTSSEESHVQVRELTPATWLELSYDDFESYTWGNYVSGGGQAKLEGKNFFASIFTSSVSAMVRDDQGVDSSFYHRIFYDISKVSDLKVHFYYYTQNMEGRNYQFLLEYTTDGFFWNPVEIVDNFQDETPLEKTVLFSASSVSVESFSRIKLRFRCHGKDRKTKVYVDNIRFEGLLAIEPSEPTMSPSSFPSATPSRSPSRSPTKTPSFRPTQAPSSLPSMHPMPEPTTAPSSGPSTSHEPTLPHPSLSPTSWPTDEPSAVPSGTPIIDPSSNPTVFPTAPLIREEICPVDRLYPPSKLEIFPYTPPPDTPAGVENDLSEISSLAFSDQTDAEGNLYAYAASDKNQYSLKVLKFTRGIQSGQVISGSGVTVATYSLDVHFSNSDWEDISLGPCDDTPTAETCIYIGDFGNNNRGGSYVQRDVLRIFKFREPVFDGSTLTDITSLPVTTILYEYAEPDWSSDTVKYDAEAMFVDWSGDSGSGKGDIYIVTKGKCTLGGVGKIPASYHSQLSVDNIPASEYQPAGASVYSMGAEMTQPPKQGDDVECGDGAFRHWQGADMRRDGRLIALITGASPPRVYFYPRIYGESVVDALSAPTAVAASCSYVASTSYGLQDERKHEVVAFLPDGKSFADTSECQSGSGCDVPIYIWDLVYPDSPDPTFRNGLIPADDWQLVSFEDFETGGMGIFTNGTRAQTSNAYSCPNDGSNVWSALIYEHNGEDSSIFHSADQDASTYSWLKIEFDFLLDGFDHMDTLFLELSVDSGASYFMVADWAYQTQGLDSLRTCYNDNVVVLNSNVFNSPTFGPSIRLRFRTSANAKNDQVYVDNIRLFGHI